MRNRYNINEEEKSRIRCLHGIQVINEQKDSGLSPEDVIKCWKEVGDAGTSINLEKMGIYKNCKTSGKEEPRCEKCWDNIVTKMFSKEEDFDPTADENMKEFITNCKKWDRYTVVIMAEYISEMKQCLNK